MKHQTIICETSPLIYDKKDSAFHRKLGWSATDWHTHARSQLIYAEHGIMRLYTADRIYYIPSQHVAWIPEGLEHRVITESSNLIFRTLYMSCNELTHPFYEELKVFFADRLLREMISYTEKFDLATPVTDEEVAVLQAIKMILPERSGSGISLQLPVTELPQMQSVMDYIAERLDEKITTADLATQFAMSERSLSRLFQKELRMPFVQYMKLVRIVKAVEQLSMPGKNVTEVAYEVGYESMPSFSNNFLEIMGRRPNTFLEK